MLRRDLDLEVEGVRDVGEIVGGESALEVADVTNPSAGRRTTSELGVALEEAGFARRLEAPAHRSPQGSGRSLVCATAMAGAAAGRPKRISSTSTPKRFSRSSRLLVLLML